MERPSSRPSDLADLAEELRRQGQLQEAIEAVERSLKENPKHPRSLLLFSRLSYQQGKVPQAREALRSLDAVLGSDWGLKTIAASLEQLWQRRSSQMDAFATETMAGLLVQQGYVCEAIEIYRQLLLASGGEDRLWDEILVLRDRLEREGSREMSRERIDRELEALDRWIKKQRGL